MNDIEKGLSWSQRTLKRAFDVVFSLTAILIVLPAMILAWVIAALETQGNGFFVQQRVGRYGVVFNVIKVKTMRPNNSVTSTITALGDTRITKTGYFFRKTKIDELPQLWNVLKGEMSFVGPRPDVPGYADKLEGGDRVILSLRPGITGPASLKYKNEEKLLSKQDYPQRYNDEVIWPDKIKINKRYIENYSFKKDIQYILSTVTGRDF